MASVRAQRKANAINNELRRQAEPPVKRRPVRLIMLMSDSTCEPVELDEEGVDLQTLDVDNPNDRLALVNAVRAALRRFK